MKSILKYSIIFPILLISFSCDDTTDDSSTGAMVGTWKLTALSGTYIRDVAVPAGTDSATTYSVKVRWPYDPSGGQADQTLKMYSTGDNVLNAPSDAAAHIAAGHVQLVGEFKNDDKYTLVGTYPALRIVEAACSTYQTIADIDDDGSYNVTYNSDLTAGTISITPLAGTEQVLPSFPDGTVTFSNEGQTMNIVFLDRDSHDSKISAISETWVEADNRVTQGHFGVFVDETGGYFTSDKTQPVKTSGYVYDPLGADGSPGTGDEQLATWGYYYTYNAVMYGGCLALGSDAATCAAAGYTTNDSDHDFDLTDATAGGKLSMQVIPVCIPVNEIILFDATFGKATN